MSTLALGDLRDKSCTDKVKGLTNEHIIALLAVKEKKGDLAIRSLDSALTFASTTGGLLDKASGILGRLRAPFSSSQTMLEQASKQYDLDQKLNGFVQKALSNRPSDTSPIEVEHLQGMAYTMSEITTTATIERSIGAFADIYVDVGREIERKIDAKEYQSPEFMKIMSYEFGQLFFEGIARSLQQDQKTPLVWKAIMGARYKKGIDPQIAASAGIAAHVIRDLPVALARTLARCRELGITLDPQAIISDYDSVNGLLGDVQKMRYEKAKKEKKAGIAFELEAMSPELVIKLIEHLRDGAFVDGVNIFQQLSSRVITAPENAPVIAKRDKLGAGLIHATLAAPTGNAVYKMFNRLLLNR